MLGSPRQRVVGGANLIPKETIIVLMNVYHDAKMVVFKLVAIELFYLYKIAWLHCVLLASEREKNFGSTLSRLSVNLLLRLSRSHALGKWVFAVSTEINRPSPYLHDEKRIDVLSQFRLVMPTVLGQSQ